MYFKQQFFKTILYPLDNNSILAILYILQNNSV